MTASNAICKGSRAVLQAGAAGVCAACGICVQVCPYGARVLEPTMAHAEVIEVLCQGCGACVAACPYKASQQKGFEFSQIFGVLEAATI